MPTPAPAPGLDLSEIPDKGDNAVPCPKAGGLRISQSAINQRMGRVFQPNKRTGNFKVSKEILTMWHQKSGKTKLQQIFQTCGYDVDRFWGWKGRNWLYILGFHPCVFFRFHYSMNVYGLFPALSFGACSAQTPAPADQQDSFIEEVEILKEEIQSNELIVEGEYLSEEAMLTVWGWSQYRAGLYL